MHPGIPYLALFAEAQAFPLFAAAAAQAQLTALGRYPSGLPDTTTAPLASALEQELLPRAAGLSIDALHLLRQQAWFPTLEYEAIAESQSSRSLCDHLVWLAGSMLEYAGDRIRLRRDGGILPDGTRRDPAACAEHWRWLSIYLPADLLVAALAASDHHLDSRNQDSHHQDSRRLEPPPEHVQIISPKLEQIFRLPCAETHLHLGAALPFHDLWASVMASLPHRGRLPIHELSPPLTLFSDATAHPSSLRPYVGPQAELLLLAAAASRVLLAAYLWRKDANLTSADFSEFVEKNDLPADKLNPHSLHAICSRIPSPGFGQGSLAEQTLRKLLACLRMVEAPPAQPSALRTLIEDGRWVCRELKVYFGRCPRTADPLEYWLLPHPGLASAETRFACRALRYLRSSQGRNDHLLNALFFQYQRVRVQLFRYLALAPGIPGLDWFTRHFNRIWPLSKDLRPRLVRHALALESQDVHLGALEIRRSPSRSIAALRKQLREMTKDVIDFSQNISGRRPEIGLVLHFIKSRELRRGKQLELHANPETNVYGSRHGRWFDERWSEVTAITRLLDMYPESLVLLRGIDVANSELAQPTWSIMPLFGQVRRASVQAAALLARSRPKWATPPLRATVHAGEDFGRLSEGLRRIHEPLAYGILQIGDRIGHALALATDPAQWARQAPVSAQLCEDRLDDLLWELERYQRAELPCDAQRMEYVRREISRLAAEIYSEERPHLDLLMKATQLRFNPKLLKELGYPRMKLAGEKQEPSDPPTRLLLRYLTSPAVYRRGQKTILVRCDAGEVAFLTAAQRFLCRELARHEITVESNPSSNLLIGGFSAIESIPTLRLQPLPGTKSVLDQPVAVSVNTDNPISFSSCLADELASVYYGLLREGVASEDALEWIGRVRQTGWHSRFTVPASCQPEVLSTLRRTFGARQ